MNGATEPAFGRIWRIVFRFVDGDVRDVDLVDYH